jgi:tetratricopeptide (TPR) repeat protein
MANASLRPDQQELVTRLQQLAESDTDAYEDALYEIKDKAVLKAIGQYIAANHPASAELVKATGSWLGTNKVAAEALVLLRIAVQLLPGNINVQDDLCHALYDNGHYAEMLETVNGMLPGKNDSDHAQKLYWKANALLALGRAAESIAPGLEAVEYWYDNHWLLFNLGYAYYTQQEYDKAIHFYSECIRHKPDFRMAYLNKACVYSLTGRYEHAYICLMQIYDMDKPYFRSAREDDELEGLFNSEYGQELLDLMEHLPVVPEDELREED